MRTILIILLGVIFAIITPMINYAGEENPSFNPQDPTLRDSKTVSTLLETSLSANDRKTIEQIRAYTQEQVGQYALLIATEFYDDLNPDKLFKTMRKISPERWKILQSYTDKGLNWLSLSKKADTFLGNQLEKALKEELGEK